MVEKLSFNVSNFHQQNFALPLKLIEFINQEAEAEIKQKLDRTCKYFYKEAPFLIIDTLVIGKLDFHQEKQRIENEAYDGCIDIMNDNELQVFLMNTSNIWLTKKLNATYNQHLDELLDEWIFEKIVRCDATEISLLGFNIPLEKLEILIKSGNVKSFDMSGSTVEDSDEFPVPLEDVLEFLPNAQKIIMDNCHITLGTMKKVLNIPWKQKISELYLKQVNGVFDAKLFFEFLKKHVEPDAQIHVDFNFQKRFWFITSKGARWFQNLFVKAYENYYHQKIESGEKLPVIGTIGPRIKQQTWMEYFLSLFVYFVLIFQVIQRKFTPTKNELKMDEVSIPQKKVSFNEDNMERQYLAFPYPHMCYIRESADAETMKKLEQTCKYFHKRNPFLIVDDLNSEADGKITVVADNKKMIFENAMEIVKIGKLLWVTNSLDLAGYNKNWYSITGRIEVKEISIGGLQFILFELFEALNLFGSLKIWNSTKGAIIGKVGKQFISLDELLFYLPNAESVCATVCGINRLSANESISLPKSNKINYLHLILFDKPINADQTFDVLKKSLAPKATVLLIFISMEMNFAEFQAQMKTKMDTWKPQVDKPTLKIVFQT